jgi:hypothetical protein
MGAIRSWFQASHCTAADVKSLVRPVRCKSVTRTPHGPNQHNYFTKNVWTRCSSLTLLTLVTMKFPIIAVIIYPHDVNASNLLEQVQPNTAFPASPSTPSRSLWYCVKTSHSVETRVWRVIITLDTWTWLSDLAFCTVGTIFDILKWLPSDVQIEWYVKGSRNFYGGLVRLLKSTLLFGLLAQIWR